ARACSRRVLRLTRLHAAMAASLMFCGVSKSGSPAPRSTTSIPSARIASATCIAASVDDAFISATRSEIGKADEDFGVDITLRIYGFGPGAWNLGLSSHAFFHDRRHQASDAAAQVTHFFDQTRAHI